MSAPSPRAIAEAEQRAVSNPAISAFVSASAGSGKTKLLTDRLLRLMLSGADPARIQCLTFTKAGAAEMSLRLHARLGTWVTADDAKLDAELAALEMPPDAAQRDAARKLFATVLDLPGGMRISTIHAFCQSLLRRFPLEAALSPHFELLDDANATAMQRTAREAMIIAAADPAQQDAIRSIAAQLSLDDFSALVDRLQERRDRLNAALAHDLPGLEAAQRRVLGVDGLNPHDIVAQAVAGVDRTTLADALARVARDGSKALAAKARSTLDWLALPPDVQADNWPDWTGFFFATTARSPRALVNDVLAARQPDLLPILLAEQARIGAVMDRLRAIDVARLSADLVRLALPSIRSYDDHKQAAGWLDYADLIGRTNALLRDPGAAWVLYKLDGGLDHLLLDEVQDTAPDQWRIADALTAEFFAGEGARTTNLPRSFFAVGDHKQSIFSFQGADPAGFDYWRDHLRRRVEAGGAQWRDAELHVSFRSTTPVLALVDEVFRDPRAAMNRSAAATSHFADRADQAGRVEIWPLTPRVIPPPSEPWEAATEYRGQTSAPQVLANALAEWIAAQIGTVDLESRGRKLHAGDILVLVRTRGAFDRALLRALKARGVPVAGLDRMVLTDQPAVADLLALCDTLLLPQDDLSLACVLTSPLGGLSDDSLMALCMGRQGPLWDTLRKRAPERPDWAAAHDFLATLFSRVDYVTPHALLTEALGQLGGRARLFARLGPQAAEPIDELLSTALAYTARNPPSLQAFLHWLRQSGSVVKREAEGAARELRIMTVHGAKGLQAPLVILPDTTSRPGDKGTLIWAKDPLHGMPVPLWSPRKDTHDTHVLQARQATTDLEREEYNRLLYVALTRAEDRLLICGWEPAKPKPECWYELVRDAFPRLDTHRAEPFAAIARPWDGTLLSFATNQTGPVQAGTAQPVESGTKPPPDWLGQLRNWQPAPPPAEPALPAALAPSRPQDDEKGPVPKAASPLATRDAAGKRFRRGQLLHSLLQHLPNLPQADRRAAARTWLNRPGTFITPLEAETLTDELMALLADPALAPLFGPGSRAEIPLTGVIETPNGPAVIGGLVDRLAELPGEILVADYKTNRDPPATQAETPVLYLRQMAAYRALLRAIFPGRAIRCALIWTRTARADWLTEAMLDTHDPSGHAPHAHPTRA